MGEVSPLASTSWEGVEDNGENSGKGGSVYIYLPSPH